MVTIYEHLNLITDGQEIYEFSGRIINIRKEMKSIIDEEFVKTYMINTFKKFSGIDFTEDGEMYEVFKRDEFIEFVSEALDKKLLNRFKEVSGDEIYRLGVNMKERCIIPLTDDIERVFYYPDDVGEAILKGEIND